MNSSDLSNCLLSNLCYLIPVRLDNSNYVTWKFLVETLLQGSCLMRYIDEPFPCPPVYSSRKENVVAADMTKEYGDWVQNDYAVMSILAATLSSDALSFVIGSKSSKEIWCRLKEKYVDDSRYNIMNIKNSLYNIQKGSDSIERYLLRVKLICDQLATKGVYMDDEEIVISVLKGLPSEFAAIKAIIRIKALSSSISMKELRSLLLTAEDEIEQVVKSISERFKTEMMAQGDMLRGSNPTHVAQGVTFPYDCLNLSIKSCSVSLETAFDENCRARYASAPAAVSTNSRFVDPAMTPATNAYHPTLQMQGNCGVFYQQQNGVLHQNNRLQQLGAFTELGVVPVYSRNSNISKGDGENTIFHISPSSDPMEVNSIKVNSTNGEGEISKFQSVPDVGSQVAIVHSEHDILYAQEVFDHKDPMVLSRDNHECGQSTLLESSLQPKRNATTRNGEIEKDRGSKLEVFSRIELSPNTVGKCGSMKQIFESSRVTGNVSCCMNANTNQVQAQPQLVSDRETIKLLGNSLIKCRQYSHSMQLCQSLPLIPPG